jgi:hypothetical protein
MCNIVSSYVALAQTAVGVSSHCKGKRQKVPTRYRFCDICKPYPCGVSVWLCGRVNKVSGISVLKGQRYRYGKAGSGVWGVAAHHRIIRYCICLYGVVHLWCEHLFERRDTLWSHRQRPCTTYQKPPNVWVYHPTLCVSWYAWVSLNITAYGGRYGYRKRRYKHT